MAKHSAFRQLNKKQIDDLFIEFIEALDSVKNSKEAASFIRDLLSEQEIVMFARRLQIANLLIAGETYENIRQALKVSFGTIARVQTWLNLYGDGYRAVIEKVRKKNKVIRSNESAPWKSLKKKYPMYFWPQLLLEEIVKGASKRERQRLEAVVNQLREKTQLSKSLDEIIKTSWQQ